MAITADFVTINLAGFTISGSGLGFGIAVASNRPLRGIAVRNGSISGFANGVTLGPAGTDGSIVEGLRVFGGTGSSTGIDAAGIVKDNTVLEFGEFGIIGIGTLIHNYVTRNQVGIFVGGGGSTAIGNTACFNQGTGIEAVCPANLTDNTAVGNGTNLVLNGEGCHNEDNVAP